MILRFLRDFCFLFSTSTRQNMLDKLSACPHKHCLVYIYSNIFRENKNNYLFSFCINVIFFHISVKSERTSIEVLTDMIFLKINS